MRAILRAGDDTSRREFCKKGRYDAIDSICIFDCFVRKGDVMLLMITFDCCVNQISF